MTKMTGREFKAFMADPDVWGPQDSNSPSYCDDTAVIVNGTNLGTEWIVEEIADDDAVKITAGYMCNRHSTKVPDSFAGAARWWLKRQKVASFVVECDKDKIDAVTAAIVAAGGKVLK